MPKVVKVKQSGKTVYRQQPEFEVGKGIKNACIMYRHKPEELEEVEISQEDYNNELEKESEEIKKERLIRLEEKKLICEQSIKNLKNQGKI